MSPSTRQLSRRAAAALEDGSTAPGSRRKQYSHAGLSACRGPGGPCSDTSCRPATQRPFCSLSLPAYHEAQLPQHTGDDWPILFSAVYCSMAHIGSMDGDTGPSYAAHHLSMASGPLRARSTCDRLCTAVRWVHLLRQEGVSVMSRCLQSGLTGKSPDLGPPGSEVALLQIHQSQPVRQEVRVRRLHVMGVLLECVSHASAIAAAALQRLHMLGLPGVCACTSIAQI